MSRPAFLLSCLVFCALCWVGIVWSVATLLALAS